MTATIQSAGQDVLTRRPLLTHELGSLAKPNWRVKAISGSPIDDGDVEEARSWGARLGVPGHEELIELLRRPELDAAAKERVRRFSSAYGVRLLEHAGVEVVYDGEQQRSEMYAWAVAHSNGFEQRGDVRAFDNKYYAKAAVTGPLSVREPFHDAEFGFVQSVADSMLKIPITGPYTIADWSFDERYDTATDLSAPAAERHRRRRAARRELILDLARNLIRPNLESLIGLGAGWIQIDEPGASTEADELDLFVEGFNQSVEGAGAVFSTHLCFSDYDLFFPAIESMTGCQQFAVGFANYDGRELGVSAERRPGYRVITKFRDLPHRPVLGLGVLDIHTDFIEPPELVRDRVLYAVEVFGDPTRIHVTPDCGLRTRTWSVAYQKLANMTAGVELAKRELGI
jgi:5-methyltetrahydropteroyltriglutamate--homocysteine methyltransferase